MDEQGERRLPRREVQVRRVRHPLEQCLSAVVLQHQAPLLSDCEKLDLFRWVAAAVIVTAATIAF
jgi:hypothetical protein